MVLSKMMKRLFHAKTGFNDVTMLPIARPNVLLSLGSNLQADNIKEGDDVYFDCRASASPTVTRLEWFHNVSKMGVLMVSNTIQ